MILFFDKVTNPLLLLSSVSFGTYDWVLLGIIVLAAFIGLIRGFTKQLFDFCSFLVVFIASILLCKVVAKLLPTDSGVIFEKINEFLSGKVTENGLEEIWLSPQNWSSDAEAVKQALVAFGLPKIFSFLVTPLTKNLSDGDILAETLPQALTGIANNIICCIALLIILGIVILILKKLFTKAVEKISLLKMVDKLLGLVFGAALAIMWISIGFAAVNLGRTIIDVQVITGFLDNNIYTTNIGGFILKISDWLISLIGM